MKKIISLLVLITLVSVPVKYLFDSNKSITCSVFGYCDADIKAKSNLIMLATAKNIISKAHPTTSYEKFEFKRIEKTEKEFLSIYEITYNSVIEGKLYMETDVVFDKNTLDFIEVRRKSDTSKVPVLELDYSYLKKIIKFFSI